MSHGATRLKYSTEVVNWWTLNLGHKGHVQERSVCMFFWNVSLGDVNRSMPLYCDTIPDTRELHYFHSKDLGDIFSIVTRKYACFCDLCIDAQGCDLDRCKNDGYVKDWKYVPLNPKGPHPISTWQEMHAEEAMVSLDHDRVSDVVRKGV